ncbi:flavodoxin [Galbibacter pacificus]|uniref:Flavodoxin n=1 Tax=Galbibacter pacificus TaxID=2996052 RepID=A0ABT6FQ91_9FLAO|nr:flavodoxin [Galbibacter pacificus]MDG3582087.1 flavodoxin [Galbibacter pacificus]MDG3585437.1 flavodoxin [Galbibacter pacificus]
MNKTFKIYFLLLIIITPVFYCSCNAQESKKENTLIVYLSRTNNTKALAEIIQKKVGGELVAIELEKPYPEDYKAIVAQVAEENQSGYQPPLKTQIDNFNAYNTVFVGFPTWGMQLPPSIKSFLHQYDMSGKTVIPFNTNAGYGVGNSFETVHSMCPNATILKGFSTKGGIERDGIYFVMEGAKKTKVEEEVIKWLRQLKLY